MQKKTKKKILISILIILLAVLIILLIQRKTSKILQAEQQNAQATVYTKIGEQEYGITNLIETNPMPMLSAGMIPIKWNDGYWEITTRNNWYDYNNGQPAFMMLNDGVYQSEEYYQMPSSKKLAEDYIGTQISANDTATLGSIYMWVPRFAYNEDGEIVYIKQECSVVGTYIIPECFTYEKDGQYFSLSGIWVEINESDAQAKANALNNGENDITYGFLANTKANAMTENEKAAVQTYLEYIDNSMKNVGADVSVRPDTQITTINHTIPKIINIEKYEPIVATAVSDDDKGIVTIHVVKHLNDIDKIIDEEGNELTISIVDGVVTGVSGYKRGERKFYIIDKIGNIKEITANVSNIDVGDIVNYDASNTINSQIYTYTTDSNLTGSTESSTFKSTDEMKWKVLSIDETTGEVEIIAADDTPSTLTLYGKKGFVNAESILDDISAVYGHGYGATSARSATIEDIEKYSTYDKTTFANSYSSTGKWGGTKSYTSGNFYKETGTKINGDKTYATTLTTASRSSPITMKQTYYYYNSATNYSTTKVGNMLIKNTKGNNRDYWLASQCVYLSSNFCGFYLRLVYSGGVYARGFYNSDGIEDSGSRAVCPVVTLNSSIQYVKNSSGEWDIK